MRTAKGHGPLPKLANYLADIPRECGFDDADSDPKYYCSSGRPGSAALRFR